LQTIRARLRRMFKRAYPWMNLTFEAWLMAYNIAYLFDRTAYYRPWLAWVGVDIRRLGLEDMVCHVFVLLLHLANTIHRHHHRGQSPEPICLLLAC
jgi:hypothetical protein